MKILIDAHLSENKLTGIGRYLNGLIKALLKQDKTNEYFLLVQEGIVQTHPLSQLHAPNLTKIPISLAGLSFRQHVVIPQILSKFKPDIYHHPHFDLPLFHNIPSVVTIHDLKYIRNPHFFPELSWVKRWYMKQMLANSITRAQKVITVSKNTKHDLIDLFNISEEKIKVIYHGLEERFRKKFDFNQMAQVLNKHGIFGKFILFVGERRPHKNIINLIKAFKLVKSNLHYSLKLVIIGKNYANYRDPEIEIARQGLEGDVHIDDFVTDEELVAFYNMTELLILPSYYEGFGFPLIEAMNCRVPVIAANNTSMPEIVGDAGLLVNPEYPEDIAAKILSILKDNQLREKLILKGLKNIKKFTWENTASQTLQVYKQIYSDNEH